MILKALARLHAVLRDQPATLIATVHTRRLAGETTCRSRRHRRHSQGDGRRLPDGHERADMNLVEPKIGSNWGDLHFMAGSAIDAPGASLLHFLNS